VISLVKSVVISNVVMSLVKSILLALFHYMSILDPFIHCAVDVAFPIIVPVICNCQVSVAIVLK